jgi:hypothetical protein
MSGDKLVFDLAQEIEGSPNVFVRKDWVNILDNQSQNYNSNQCVIDTSQLSNSNKYMSYREAYIMMPLLLTLSSADGLFQPATAGTSSDYALGLKNWFGTMIHSITVDMAGTTIIQQTPYINMWNSFKLMTSLSWGDVATQGATIGFYPDDPLSFSFQSALSLVGAGVCNNSNHPSNLELQANITTSFNSYKSNTGNVGLARRQQYINFDPAGIVEGPLTAGAGALTYGNLLSASSAVQLWKSHIFFKRNSAVGPPAVAGMLEIAVSATIYLKHLHSFFAMAPLLKGAFFKITLNLNNTTTTLAIAGTTVAGPPVVTTTESMALTSVSNSVGGVNPLMVASAGGGQGAFNLQPIAVPAGGASTSTYLATVQVGGRCLNNTVTAQGVQNGPLAQSVFLYVPAYTFNPVFEEAYLSSPVKEIKYTDVYQYQVLNVSPDAQFNNLLTNGISDLRSVLLLPFYSVAAGAVNTGLPVGIPVYQSPFDPAGTGATSPLALFSNFNVVVSGQNAIYNTERYTFEQFNNQLYGANAVNAGMTDGLTSGLFDALGFEMEYAYWYVNVSRMLPVEASVPKSVQIVGTNKSQKALDLWCFLEYGVSVSVDILTGSRV